MKPTIKPRIWLIGLMVLILGTTLTTENAENTETLVIDLSKTLPGNPYQEEYERMLYPTVRVKTLTSTGSGVIFHRRDAEDAENIYVLTAAHMVGDNSEVTVEIFTAKDAKDVKIEATVVITDTVKDLALISTQISADFKDKIYSAKLADKNYKPFLFSPIYTVGCSLGLIPRPSSGIITYIGDNLRPSASHWEISSPILPGNSGGPVYDARTYEVIGIAVWVHTYKNQIVTTMAGIVPINQIYEFINHRWFGNTHHKFTQMNTDK